MYQSKHLPLTVKCLSDVVEKGERDRERERERLIYKGFITYHNTNAIKLARGIIMCLTHSLYHPTKVLRNFASVIY